MIIFPCMESAGLEVASNGRGAGLRFQDEKAVLVRGAPVRAFATGSGAWRAEVVVGVALHDQARSLPECLASIASQRHAPRIGVLILDDGSTDDWTGAAAPWLTQPGTVVVARSRCGTAARARNLILDLADALFPAARWVARLDADDRFACDVSLGAACATGDSHRAAYVLGGNRLRVGGELLPRTNPATEHLLDPAFLVTLLQRMADATAENELPSCNLLLARGSGFRYPDVVSAEDHWLVTDLLINHPGDGVILPAPFYCDYTLDGGTTGANRRSAEYLRSRRALHGAARRWASAVSEAERACC